MPSPARLAAYAAFRSVDTEGLTLADALARTRTTLTDPRDRSLAAEIVTGALRWRALLDHLVQSASRRDVARLDPEILDILRLSVYQIVYLDRVPASAVVDDGVEMTRSIRKASAAAFVNGVLRALVRQRQHLPLPAHPGRNPDERVALDYLSTALSHPRWLAARWLSREGFAATEAWAQFNNTPARLTLRTNRLKIGRDELIDRLAEHGSIVERTRFAPDGLVVVSGNPLQTPLAGRGLFFVQDESSQLVAALTHAVPGDFVLDACASPGGKSTAMAADMADDGFLAAVDLRPRRIALLRQTVAESGAASIRIVRADLSRGAPFSAAFDLVLVDAPCSGLGTIRRDPEIRWRRQEDQLPALAGRELSILTAAASAVRPAGRLIYSTCSSEPEENDGVVAAFLEAHPQFSITRPQDDPRLRDGVRTVIDSEGFLRTSPVRHQLEPFFAAMMVRRGAAMGPTKGV